MRRSQSTVEITAASCIGEIYGREKDIMVIGAQLVGIANQYNEIIKRVARGSLDPKNVEQALQAIIEYKLPMVQSWSLPAWWRTPEQQLARARQLWPDAVLPEPPKEFTPRTKSEVPLLHVPDSFDSLWDKVVAPQGYAKDYPKEETDGRNLCYAPNTCEYTEPVWLAFDPQHGKGHSASLWGQANLAASEIFSALIQFPEWALSWYDSTPAPILSGYLLKHNGRWSHTLGLVRWDDGRELRLLSSHFSDGFDEMAASPSVREC